MFWLGFLSHCSADLDFAALIYLYIEKKGHLSAVSASSEQVAMIINLFPACLTLPFSVLFVLIRYVKKFFSSQQETTFIPYSKAFRFPDSEERVEDGIFNLISSNLILNISLLHNYPVYNVLYIFSHRKCF